MTNTKVKKVLDIVSKVLAGIVIAVTVAMVIFTVFSTLTFDKNDRPVFGIRFYIVLSDSMSLSENNKDDKVHFDAGDIVLIKNVKDARALEPGDIIAFISQNDDNRGETVTHKIKSVVKTDDGRVVGYETFGTNTGAVDKALVDPDFVLGTYAGKLPKVGHFFSFLKTTLGYIVCILIPFIILILWQGANTIRIYRQYKREQMAELEEERKQIAKEREESAQMMRELQALKEQLAQKTGEIAPPAETATSTEQQSIDAIESTEKVDEASDGSSDSSDSN